MSKLEKEYEQAFCKEVRGWDKSIRVYKNDPSSTAQGVPDRIVLFDGKFAMLEFKRSKSAVKQANQDWYVDFYNANNGFARFVSPENGEEIKKELKRYLGI